MAYYIGLMSGTSMDGVDAVLCDIGSNYCHTLEAHTEYYSAELLDRLHGLCNPGHNEVNLVGIAERAVASYFAKATHGVLEKAGIDASQITALGSHGQTIRHFPDGLAKTADTLNLPSELNLGFTTQIGCPHTLAVLTGIDVVSDFRRKDVALGGQGAPLVPAYHNAVFAHKDAARVVVNLGGIANISILSPSNISKAPLGYDTGPSNTLMDAWCKLHTGKSYDTNGEFAQKGTVLTALLMACLNDPYFTLPSPKSTGREYFNLAWLASKAESSLESYKPEDVQATLLALTAKSVCNAIAQHKLQPNTDVILCGGGVFNSVLINAIKEQLPNFNVLSSQVLGQHPQHIEGAAFAWLAYAYDNNIHGNVPAVTGARRSCVLGTKTLAT